jgi:hypothetical protein
MNCESGILRKKYICKSNTVNNMKLMILEKNQGNLHMFLQPTRSECFLAKSCADIQTGRISGMFSQAEFSSLFELPSYHLASSGVASVSHLSLKFDLRHTRFIFTRQNITVGSSHMSEYHAHHIFPGVMSHISICC